MSGSSAESGDTMPKLLHGLGINRSRSVPDNTGVDHPALRDLQPGPEERRPVEGSARYEDVQAVDVGFDVVVQDVGLPLLGKRQQGEVVRSTEVGESGALPDRMAQPEMR